MLEEAGEEEKYLVVCELLARAVSLAHQEGDAPLILPELARHGGQEPVGVEQLRGLPVVGVVHDPGDVGVHGGPSRDVPPVEHNVLRGGVGDGVVETGVSQDLVDDGLGVGHPRSVLQHCTS